MSNFNLTKNMVNSYIVTRDDTNTLKSRENH